MQQQKNNREGIMTPVKKNWYKMALYILSGYVLTQAVVSGTSRIAAATDSLFAGASLELWILVPPFLILTMIGTIAAFVKSYMQNSFSVNVQTEIKNIATSKLVRLQYSYFDKEGSATIMNKLISDVYHLEELFSEVLPQLILSIVTIGTIGVYIFVADPRLFMVTVVCYPLLLWLANVMSIKMGKLTGNRLGLYDKLENTALDNFNGMVVGRSFNLNDILRKRIDDVVDAILKNEYTRTLVSSVSQVVSNLIRWIPPIVCYVFALYEVLRGSLSVGDLLAFSMLLDRIVHPFGEIPGLINTLREDIVSFKRLNAIVKEPEEPSGTGKFEPTAEVVELAHVQFAYDSERKIFTDLNLKIEQGKSTALVGTSGGGKSTVFRILCGFYAPSEGSYKLYGHDVKEWDLKELRKQFSLVSQNVFLFPDTIAANVGYGREGASRQDIIDACKYANIHDFIEGLPDGYDTYVGERGVKLSGGQRQRISIARAFLKQAPILLLDEPTSAVDIQTEKQIQEALHKISQGKTVITIAHRLSTITDADEILVFDKGVIAESGTHEELMAAQGVYHSLYTQDSKLQKLDEQWMGGEQ